MLAATVRVAADLDLAEECVQHAYAKALTTWTSLTIPDRPGAWLTTVAKRHALDAARHRAVVARNLPLLVDDRPGDSADRSDDGLGKGFGDDRLRLIFTCCHPALAVDAQVALTLRLVGGLSTAEVARSFLVAEPTMAARITRAKKKIAAARIPYRIPAREELPERIASVLDVIHLIFTTGHTAPDGPELVRQDLIDRASDLAEMVHALMPGHPEAASLLALITLIDSRRSTRIDEAGNVILLADQDRARWDHEAIARGVALVSDALRAQGPPGRFALMAAIAAAHSEAPSWTDTDWAEIVGLYDLLAVAWPSPVVALNRAVAIGFASGPAVGVVALDELAIEPRLVGYPYLSAARADFLRQLGRTDEARLAYGEALLLTANPVERRFLNGRLDALVGG